MAKIEIIREARNDFPSLTETIEVRVWSLVGTAQQFFYIGSGFNAQASGNIWLEIFYTVEDAQIFYTRNFLHHTNYATSLSTEQRLDKVIEQGEGAFGFGDMMPETSIILTVESYKYQDSNDEEKKATSCKLVISADTGVVFGRTAPGERSVEIKLNELELEEGARFMRDLIHEIDAVTEGRHPDPAGFPDGSSEWPFLLQLNRRAYNKISVDYQETYFENPLLAQTFGDWISQLPVGAHVLDAGCGHGSPVIARLLESGLQVTGSDFSPAMLSRASQQFPQVAFINQTTSGLTQEEVFDGACSFNSFLYLDPIDLFQAIHRLHHALKPGGLLFLYAYDSGPDWRGEPLSFRVGEMMWSWHYGMEEAAHMLAEHGYFEVIEMRKIIVDEADNERVAQEIEKQKKEEEEFYRKQADAPDDSIKWPFFKTPVERAAYSYQITARRCDR